MYLGDGLYGVEAAARGYFGKYGERSDRRRGRAARGLIQSPSSYAPTVNLDRAIARRNVVLQTMVSTRCRSTRRRAERARQAPRPPEERARNQGDVRPVFQGAGPAGAGRALRLAARVPRRPARLHDARPRPPAGSREAGRERHSPTSSAAAAIRTCRGTSSRRLKEGELAQYLQGALVAMDPRPGTCAPWWAGATSARATSIAPCRRSGRRGPRSSRSSMRPRSKPGIPRRRVITNLDDPIATPQGDWVPEDEHSTADSMTLRTALRTSSNRAAVQMLNTVGIPKAVVVRAEAERRNAAERPVACARCERSHADLADRCLRRVRRQRHRPAAGAHPQVEDSDGNVLCTPTQAKAHRAVSEATAFLMSSMLADVINAGTAYRARQSGFTLPAAGKTGTTNDYVDAWFVGYTPHLVTGVWVGFDQPSTIASNGYAGDTRGAGLGELHESRDQRRQARVVRPSVKCRRRQRLPRVGEAPQRRLQQRGSSQPRRRDRNRGRWSTRSPSSPGRNRRTCARCIHRHP